MDPSHFVAQRLFVFDSCAEDVRRDLDLNCMGSGGLVTFPPIESTNVHVNLVVNDLAVAVFVALERRITALNRMVAVGIQR